MIEEAAAKYGEIERLLWCKAYEVAADKGNMVPETAADIALARYREKFAAPTSTPPMDPVQYSTTASEPDPTYEWKQCYEIGNDRHWALCDTNVMTSVVDARLVLYCRDSTTDMAWGLPARIVELLNRYGYSD